MKGSLVRRLISAGYGQGSDRRGGRIERNRRKMENCIDIGFANLRVEVDERGSRPEVYITFEKKEEPGCIRDICMVSQAVRPGSGETIPDSVRCLVWSDIEDENYTHEILITGLHSLGRDGTLTEVQRGENVNRGAEENESI